MKKIIEGSLYKSITVQNNTFDIYYGYYSDTERNLWEPVPIFPDFIKAPMFTKEGIPYCRADQDICEHFLAKPNISGEDWCNDCQHFNLCEELIGVCLCSKRKNKVSKNE